MKIITLPVGQLQTNCYLYYDEKTRKSLIIDPGDDADYISRIISDRSLSPQLIVATHGHFDHIMAVFELKLAYKIPFKISYRDNFLGKNMSSSARHFISIDGGPSPTADANLVNNEKIKIGSSRLTVIETPGHTPGSVCLYDSNNGVMFTGDTLFAEGGIGRTDFSYSNHQQLLSSLKKIFRLPPHTLIYPGHGNSSTLAEETVLPA